VDGERAAALINARNWSLIASVRHLTLEQSVPDLPMPQHVLELLAKPNPAVMATIAADGRPVTVATWYLLEPDGTILLGLDSGRARLNHLHRDPRVSLTALAADVGVPVVSVQGQVGPIVEDVDLRDIDRLSTHYTGRPYGNRDRPRVSTHLEITRWHGWSAGGSITD
jgi:PPOX class probable F420-dependent enzyme